MPQGGPNSERVLLLAPHGRDAQIAADLLKEAGRHTFICRDVTCLCIELEKGAAFAVIAEEAIVDSDLSDLTAWIKDQPPWSDIPIVLLTGRGDSPGRVELAGRYQDILGNVSYLERPFHPTTLISVARSAIRSRRRQYEARSSLERYILLARELQHRTKNLLTVIQSLASASLPHGPAREDYFGRLHALARAQDLLLEGDGRGASIKDLVAQALESFGQRVTVNGPHVQLTASIAQGFALILHELATNASKHGSLSKPNGSVTVQWSRVAGSPPALIFRWSETGGPPASLPKSKGFGTQLLEVAVTSTDGQPRFEYSADGFVYELRAALEGPDLNHL
jgi:two-component sensor histidine kinase